MMIHIPTQFNAKPSRTIVLMGIRSVPYTAAFGAVATGNINAQLALIAAGIIKY